MHLLDNPVWHALTGPHATVAQRAGRAARYVPEVAAFAALPDEPTPDAWNDLRALVGAAATAILARRDLAVPETWTVQFASPCRQMLLPGPVPLEAAPGADLALVRLGAPDVPEMLSLVKRTRPGPFATRTVELGSYVGVRDGDALIAMAGERLHPQGFTEISAVCTAPEHQGRGLASRLVRAVAHGIRERGETPFLNLTLENDAAHRIYSALGFETRTFFDVVGVQAPL